MMKNYKLDILNKKFEFVKNYQKFLWFSFSVYKPERGDLIFFNFFLP